MAVINTRFMAEGSIFLIKAIDIGGGTGCLPQNNCPLAEFVEKCQNTNCLQLVCLLGENFEEILCKRFNITELFQRVKWEFDLT